MDPILKEQYIASLILKERFAGLTESERSQLSSWRQESPEHERLYAHLSSKDFSEDLSRYGQIDVERGLEEYHRRYAHTTPRRRLGYRYGWVAAVVILMIGIPTFFFYKADRPVASERIEPISSKAVLVLGGGERIDLTVKEADVFEQGNASVRNNGTELQYVASDTLVKEEQVRYNELIIPKGGEFTLVLADGTKIWLNSQTKIKYPVTFAQGGRDVYLEGEAYFEVAKDSLSPFRVTMRNNVQVEVLGTSFNVRGYTDEAMVETVLETGSVRITDGGEQVVLVPGEKALCRPDRKIEVAPVRTELYTAWHKGEYIFENESLEHIFSQFSRWYGLEVFYANEEIKSIAISGDVQRYDDINILLRAIEIVGGVHCKLNGRTLVVGW